MAVAVIDCDSRPVCALTAADFIVLEDGRAPRITAFSEIGVSEAVLPHVERMRERRRVIRGETMPLTQRGVAE